MTAALEVQGLAKDFGGVPTLVDVTVTVPRGGVLGVIGPNGAGKSTLVNVVSGHLAPSAGRILVNGQDLTGAPPWRLARAGVARTFQVARLFQDLTASENVALSAMYAQRLGKRTAMGLACRLLDTVGLPGSAAQPAGQLTIADRRRLELARALATGPSVLILDEILAGMAHRELAAGLEVLLRLKDEDMTMVIVEHHLGAVKALCDEVLVLMRGAVVDKGPPGAVLADPRVIRAYLGGYRG